MMVDPNNLGQEDSVLIIQFAREPVPGRVKTRLTTVLSPQEACDLHCELVHRTSGTLVRAVVGPVELYVAGDTHHWLFAQCIELGVVGVRPQWGSDLGERMFNALQTGLNSYSKVVLVGSDCPVLDQRYLQAARDALRDVDVVLGPAVDGGYVLIGVRCLDARWFEAVGWGGAEVCADTVSRLRDTQSSYRLLTTLWDVDRPEDLDRWRLLQEAPD